MEMISQYKGKSESQKLVQMASCLIDVLRNACHSSCPEKPSCRIEHVIEHVGGESLRLVQSSHELVWLILQLS